MIARVHENSITLTWTMNDRSGILHYEIEYETSEIKTILKTEDPSKTEFTITDLQWKMTYTIRVRVIWGNDQTGNWSSSITADTGMLNQLEDELKTQFLALL